MRHDDTVPMAPPAKNWKLVARRRFTADKIYNAGCEVPVAALGKNFAAMLAGHFVSWQPPGTPIAAKPLPVPPPAKPLPRPSAEIVADDDVVESWRKTLALMVERCDGNRQRADDILHADRAARDLYRLAVATACQKEAVKRGRSVCPTELGF